MEVGGHSVWFCVCACECVHADTHKTSVYGQKWCQFVCWLWVMTGCFSNAAQPAGRHTHTHILAHTQPAGRHTHTHTQPAGRHTHADAHTWYKAKTSPILLVCLNSRKVTSGQEVYLSLSCNSPSSAPLAVPAAGCIRKNNPIIPLGCLYIRSPLCLSSKHFFVFNRLHFAIIIKEFPQDRKSVISFHLLSSG